MIDPAYQSYRNLPPVAGIASFAEAARPGFSIDECGSTERNRPRWIPGKDGVANITDLR